MLANSLPEIRKAADLLVDGFPPSMDAL